MRKMKLFKKQAVSIVLAAAMMCSVVPMGVGAAEENTLPGKTPEMIVSEDFSNPLTDAAADHAKTIIPYVEFYESGNITGAGKIALTAGESGAAKWVADNLGGIDLMIPFGPGTTIDATGKHAPKLMTGEFMFEFDLERLAAVKSQPIAFYLRNGSRNVAKLRVSSTSVYYDYYYSGNNLTGYTSATVSGEAHNFRLLLGTESGKQYLGGLWIDGKAIKTTRQELSAYPSEGWKVIVAEPADKWVTGDLCSIDNIRVWRPTANQLSDLIVAGNDNITFEQIKGANTDAANVTANLDL